MKNLNKRIAKKCWKEIKAIQTAGNMMDVEHAIYNSVQKTFSLWDIGLQKITARKNGELVKFEAVRQAREVLTKYHKKDIMSYMFGFIQERMKASIMYKKLESEITKY